MPKSKQKKEIIPCLLDPWKDCPEDCRLHAEAKQKFLEWIEAASQWTEKGIFMVGGPEKALWLIRSSALEDTLRTRLLEGLVPGRNEIRTREANRLTASGMIGECHHPEGNILNREVYQAEYQGPVPCLLDPLHNCPQGLLGLGKCGLREKAREEFLQKVIELGETPEKTLYMIRDPKNDYERRHTAWENYKSLNKSGVLNKCKNSRARNKIKTGEDNIARFEKRRKQKGF